MDSVVRLEVKVLCKEEFVEQLEDAVKELLRSLGVSFSIYKYKIASAKDGASTD